MPASSPGGHPFAQEALILLLPSWIPSTLILISAIILLYFTLVFALWWWHLYLYYHLVGEDFTFNSTEFVAPPNMKKAMEGPKMVSGKFDDKGKGMTSLLFSLLMMPICFSWRRMGLFPWNYTTIILHAKWKDNHWKSTLPRVTKRALRLHLWVCMPRSPVMCSKWFSSRIGHCGVGFEKCGSKGYKFLSVALWAHLLRQDVLPKNCCEGHRHSEWWCLWVRGKDHVLIIARVFRAEWFIQAIMTFWNTKHEADFSKWKILRPPKAVWAANH